MKYFSSLSAQICENTTLLYGHFRGCKIKSKLDASDNTSSTIVLIILGIRWEKLLHSSSEAVLLRLIQEHMNINRNFQPVAISPPPGDISSASNEISF